MADKKLSKEEEARRNMSDPDYKEEGLQDLSPYMVPPGRFAGVSEKIGEKIAPKVGSAIEKVLSKIPKIGIPKALVKEKAVKALAGTAYQAGALASLKGKDKDKDTPKKYKKGGIIKSRGDGVAQRGRTKGKIK